MQKNTDINTAVKTVIMGLGKTGYSCAQFLSRQQIAFKLVDSRKNPPLLARYLQTWPSDSLSLGDFNQKELTDIETVIVSPGISWKEPFIQEALQRQINVISDIELFARNARAPIIAITGSNGKSTVTTLLGEMIRSAGHPVLVGGNLGTPALDLLDGTQPDYYVIEVSSFHLDLTSYLPLVAAVVLNVSQDHMDRYESFEEYAHSKSKIYRHAEFGVYNKDDATVLNMHHSMMKSSLFTTHSPLTNEFGLVRDNGKLVLAYGESKLMPVDELKIKGKHNAINVLACLALGSSIGLPMDAMLQAAKKFPGLPHRCQWVATIKGIDWFNDSKATNVGAAVASIGSMPGKIILIAGGDGKGADFTEFGRVVSQYAHAVVLLGRDAELIASVLSPNIDLIRVKTIEEAVQCAFKFTKFGDSVLLAPGCSSLDMFENYEERGDRYSAAVRLLAEENPE